MAVQAVLGKLGQWSIKLKKNAPPGVISALQWFGTVVVVPGRMDPVEHGDYLLAKGVARYAGILRDVVVASSDGTSQATLTGVHVTAWLGDEDGKGDNIESPGVVLTGATFAAAVAALAPLNGAGRDDLHRSHRDHLEHVRLPEPTDRARLPVQRHQR